MKQKDIYDSNFVKSLFNEMSATYGTTNYVSSFGFCQRWREQCVQMAKIEPGMYVYDLMTGMGECWHLINRKLRNEGALLALDFSPEMCRKANERVTEFTDLAIEVVEEDFLSNKLHSDSADCIISTFGLKTFSDAQKKLVASEIARLLKPGGNFALLEISVPKSSFLRGPYMHYLRYCIPGIGRMFLGDPDNYRMLGKYTDNFGDCSYMGNLLDRSGLEVEMKSFFFGCATALRGVKVA